MKGKRYPNMICAGEARHDWLEEESFTECLWRMPMNGDAPVLSRKCQANKISYITTKRSEVGLSEVASGRLRCRIVRRGEQRFMDKRLLSQVLDGAAFPMVILALAVSQVKVNPHRKGTFRETKGVAVEARMGGPTEQKAKEAKVH